MLTRILLLLLVTALALPVAAVTPLSEASRASRSEVSEEARKKGKNGKKTVRRSVTRTFTNPTAITLPASGPGDPTQGVAGPYPSLITVGGFVNGRILDLNLTLHSYNQTEADNADVMLAPAHLPTVNAIVMSDAGGNSNPSNVTVTLDDQAAAALPEVDPLVSGTFRPTNHGVAVDIFPPNAPAPSENSTLSVFNASDPNGTWQLFVVDDEDQDIGAFAGGWSLRITAEVDVKKGKRRR